ncbi:MAG: hypothetical protein AB1486_09490 [Planctomycetota bacterium]
MARRLRRRSGAPPPTVSSRSIRRRRRARIARPSSSILLEYVRSGERAPDLPVWCQYAEEVAAVKARAERLATRLREARRDLAFAVVESQAQLGSGSYPGRDVASWAVAVQPNKQSTAALDAALRTGPLPIFSRVKDDCILLDMRTVREGELDEIVAVIRGLQVS